MIENLKNKIIVGKDKMIRGIAAKALEFGLKHNQEYFKAKVQTVAERSARNILLEALRREGITHCAFCLKRYTLYRYGDAYLCKDHFQQMRKAETKQNVAPVRTIGENFCE